jgi:predicted GIY-YIG superfamily endonuclease
MTATMGTVYLIHFNEPYKHARHYIGWALNVKRRLAEHAAGRGANLLAVVRDAGIGWQLARMWPGTRTRERQIKRQGGASRYCPLCGIRPRTPLPRNRDGSLSRSRTTDAQKAAAGVMTAAQMAEHTALRHGLVSGKLPRPLERGPLADDPWLLPVPVGAS